MQIQDISLNQIVIVILFLGFLITLQQLIKRNKLNFQSQFNKRRRISLVDDFGISPSERIRLLRVDNKEYLYIYSKGSAPTIFPHEVKESQNTRNRPILKEAKREEKKAENIYSKEQETNKPNILSEAISVARKMNPQLGFKK